MVILALGSLSMENLKIKASLCCIVRSCFKREKKQEKEEERKKEKEAEKQEKKKILIQESKR